MEIKKKSFNELGEEINKHGSLLGISLVVLSKQIKEDMPFLGTDRRDSVITSMYEWLQCQQRRLYERFDITEEQMLEIIHNAKIRKRIEYLKTMPYQEYLQTPEWKERRLRILERDSYRCQVCNSPDHLNVHHRDYSRRGDEEDSDLTTLCQGCHQVFHENSRLARVEA